MIIVHPETALVLLAILAATIMHRYELNSRKKKP